MLGFNRKHSLVTVAVAAGLLAAAGPASAAGVKDGTWEEHGLLRRARRAGAPHPDG